MNLMKSRGVKIIIMLVLNGLILNVGQTAFAEDNLTLKSRFDQKFFIGTALNMRQIAGEDTCAERIVKQHFNSVVAENCMKSEELQPSEGVFTFQEADQFVRWGENNNMRIIGHCLIWHSQLPQWFCKDEQGKLVSPEVLKNRMRDHIYTVVGRYKGRVHGWDVVNEAIEDDGSWRKSPFYEIMGEEFIAWAFQCAHEADPDAELYYNDYNMYGRKKRAKVVELVQMLKVRGLRIDAVGMQGHIGIDYPSIKQFEQSILAFSAVGVKVMITELDMSALPTVSVSANVSERVAYNARNNPYTDGLPLAVAEKWNRRMYDFFHLFLKHADVITRVTVWGVSDNDSWKNNFPVRGRTDYPLLFDRQCQMKPFVKQLLEEKQ